MALTPFEQEFKSQRELLGPGKTFTFKGKEYTTDYAKPKTESNRGGARMKSGKDIMDTLPKVGKVKTGEIAPISTKTMYADRPDRAEVSGGSGDYMSKVLPKQKIGFKAEDMGMNQYKKPELDDFIPTKKAIPGRFDKPMSKLPGRFPGKEEADAIKKSNKDTESKSAGLSAGVGASTKSSGLSVGLGAEPKEDVQTREQRLRDSLKSMANSPLTPKAGDRPLDEPADPKSQAYRKGGKVDFSKIIRNKKTGVLSMKKAEGGLVTAKRSSKRGCGIAVKGFGRAGGR